MERRFVRTCWTMDVDGFTLEIKFKIYNQYNVSNGDGTWDIDYELVDEFEVTQEDLRNFYDRDINAVYKEIEEEYNCEPMFRN